MAVATKSHATGTPAVRHIELTSGDEITSQVYGNNQQARLLWLSSSYGFHERHIQVALQLASDGMEIWQVNLAENLFLTKGADSMRKISPLLVADLINQVSEKGKYRVLVMSSGYGSITALRGVHAWQSLYAKPAVLDGVILFSPYLFSSVPSLGNPPELIEETYATNVPVYIFQADKNGNRWHLPAMLNALQQHAPVYTELLKGVTSLFYDKDTAPKTLSTLGKISKRIEFAQKQLAKHPFPDQPVVLQKKKSEQTGESGLNAEMTIYRGKVQPASIRLHDVNGKQVVVDDYKGMVTLINFWATWCTPCIEEIPSLNRLKQKMKDKPFRLISVNYAESAENIKSFMRKVAVDFPVLVDPEGKHAGQWKVLAFPSTFVIGPDGKIRYGVNAAIHWDTDEVIRQLEALMP